MFQEFETRPARFADMTAVGAHGDPVRRLFCIIHEMPPGDFAGGTVKIGPADAAAPSPNH
ncbi:hypothetical protein Rhsp01_03440 [Rhizobium sp. NBRC 114257]|nr:hypothetical protein Rhsp01_03440 [Rhizobium sp. NBRC 114257]